MDRLEAKRIVRRVEELPTLPAIITRILEVVEDDRSSARDLEQVISRDHSIATKILRIANSAYYGFSRRIRTVHQAVVILGFQTVRGLALGTSIFETFFRARGDRAAFDRTGYWLHSIACSRCATAIGAGADDMDPEETFLAGLIHDIGLVVMDHVMHSHYRTILRKALDQGIPLHRLEKETWGFDHGDVGAWLGERWKFPRSLVDAIRFHHRLMGARGSAERLAAVIHLADFCADQAGLGVTGTSNGTDFERKALGLMGMSRGNLDDLTHRIERDREEIMAFFSAMSS